MKKIEEMNLFELNEYRSIIKMFKEKYGKMFVSSGYDPLCDTYLNETEETKKFNFLQNEMEKIDKIMEEIILKDYDKKN